MVSINTFTLAGHTVTDYCVSFQIVRQINSLADSFVGTFVKNELDAVHVPVVNDQIVISYSVTPGVVGQFVGKISAVSGDLTTYTLTAYHEACRAHFAVVSWTRTVPINHDLILFWLLQNAGIGTITNQITVYHSVSSWRTLNQVVLDQLIKASFLSKGSAGTGIQTIFMTDPGTANAAVITDMGFRTPSVAALDPASGTAVGEIVKNNITDEIINDVTCIHSGGSRNQQDATSIAANGRCSLIINYPELKNGNDTVAGDAGLVTGTYLAIYKNALTQYTLRAPVDALYETANLYTPLNSRYSIVYNGSTISNLPCVKHVINYPSFVDEITLGDYTQDLSSYLADESRRTGSMEASWAGGTCAVKAYVSGTGIAIGPLGITLPADTTIFDLTGGSYVTGTYEFVAPVAGIYEVMMNVRCNVAAGDWIQLRGNVNTYYDTNNQIRNDSASAQVLTVNCSSLLNLAKGDVFRVAVFSGSASSLVVGGLSSYSWFSVDLRYPL